MVSGWDVCICIVEEMSKWMHRWQLSRLKLQSTLGSETIDHLH